MDKCNQKQVELAKKIAMRLERVGMRITYKELFDLFLAETTATWPIVIIFSKSKSKYAAGNDAVFKNPTFTLADDCNQAAAFLLHLNSKQREAVYSTQEIIHGNIENYMHRPKTTGHSYSDINCASKVDVKEIMNGFRVLPEDHSTMDEMLFCHKIRDACGLVFIRLTKAGMGLVVTVGHGIVMSRLEDGWSPPCSIGCFGIGGGLEIGCEQNDILFLIYDEKIIQNLKEGKQLVLGGNAVFSGFGKGYEICGVSHLNDHYTNQVRTPESSFSAFARNNAGLIVGISVEGISITPIDYMNRSAYGPVTSMDILTGNVDPFEHSLDINKALRYAEFPYSLCARPIVPYFLRSYARSVWSIDYSSPLSEPLSFSFRGTPKSEMCVTLREFLLRFSLPDHLVSPVLKNELANFVNKFKRFLREGIPVMYLINGCGKFEERVMYLLKGPYSSKLSDARIRFFDKNECIKGTKKRRKLSEDLFKLKNDDMNEYIVIGRVVSMTQEVPPSIRIQNNHRNQFICMENDTGSYRIFYAQTESDATLLLSGLKLLLERNDEF